MPAKKSRGWSKRTGASRRKSNSLSACSRRRGGRGDCQHTAVPVGDARRRALLAVRVDMLKPGVKFAGTEHGLLMRLEWEAPLPQLLVELEEHLQQSREFFDGAQVLLEIGRRPVPQKDMEQLTVVLSRYGVTLQGVIPAADSPDRRSPLPARHVTVPPPTDPQTLLRLERRTVRSGEKIASEGHIVILGDVNPGAEII